MHGAKVISVLLTVSSNLYTCCVYKEWAKLEVWTEWQVTSCILSVLLLSASSDHLDLLSFAVQYAPRIQLITLLHQLHFSFTQSNIYSDQYNKCFIKKGEISWEWMFGLFRLFGKMTKFLPTTNDSETITQKKKMWPTSAIVFGPHLTLPDLMAAQGNTRQLQLSHRSTKYWVTSGTLSTCYKPRQARLMTFMEHLVCRKQLCVPNPNVSALWEDWLLVPFFLWSVVVCVNQESGPFPPTCCRMWVNRLGFSLSRGSETILSLLENKCIKNYAC